MSKKFHKIIAITGGVAALLAGTAAPAWAGPGPLVKVCTTDTPPAGGCASFDPRTGKLVVEDFEVEGKRATASLVWNVGSRRFAAPKDKSVASAVVQLPQANAVKLQVCLGRTFCSPWKSTHT